MDEASRDGERDKSAGQYQYRTGTNDIDLGVEQVQGQSYFQVSYTMASATLSYLCGGIFMLVQCELL